MNSSKREDNFARFLDRQGVSYKRQVKIGPYWVDFLLADKQVLEIDGKHHLFKKRIYHDRIRDEYLANMGYSVIHIPAKSCLRNPHKRTKPTLRTL
jgi:very-short-patch-repair endonuclease